MYFEILRIAGVRNSVFSRLSLCYVKYLKFLCNFTVWGFCRVDYWILNFVILSIDCMQDFY